MRIAMIGSGYVGLVSGACFSEFGTDVVCVDNDQDKIARLRRGEIPIYEPGLEDLVARNTAAGRLTFSDDLAAAVEEADAVFLAVGTPTRRGDGQADLTFVEAAVREIAKALKRYSVIVTKSTVPVGTGRRIAGLLAEQRPDLAAGEDYDVASNPEFLREGSAIEDFMRPDRVVIGCQSERAAAVLRALYRPLFLNETPILFADLETAELIKYAANAFLATKITFINEMADICEKLGGNVQQVARGIGLDGRIGSKFLHAGPGYGGSCFPKDTLALVTSAREAGTPTQIVEAVVAVNEQRKQAMADKIVAHCGGSVAGKTIAVLGLTFKPNTDDMRDAPSLVIVPRLQEAGAKLRVHDPVGMEEAKKLLTDLEWLEDPYDAATGADCLVIVTEWNQFRNLDLDRIRELMGQPAMVDLRNIYQPDDMAARGFHYASVGRSHNEAKRP